MCRQRQTQKNSTTTAAAAEALATVRQLNHYLEETEDSMHFFIYFFVFIESFMLDYFHFEVFFCVRWCMVMEF
jgi:phosphate starvation-inducible membrane PsiE